MNPPSAAPFARLALATLPLAVLISLGCSSTESPAPADAPAAAGGGEAGSGGSGGDGGGGGLGGAGGAEAGPIGGDRPVEVYVPPGYQAGTPAPLLVLLHGYTATGALQNFYFNLKPLVDEHGFLYAHPDGTRNSEDTTFWNATDACCDFDRSNVDDEGYLTQVIADIRARYDVDPKRIYLVGHSNGGFMSYRIACHHADTIAAVVSLAGATYKDPAACSPSGPVSVLQIHGTADDTILYQGGDVGLGAHPSAPETAQQWATFNGCATPPVAGAPVDVDASLQGSETSVQVYNDCAPGGHVELWTIEGGGHVPSLVPSFNTMVFDFLLKHPKP